MKILAIDQSFTSSGIVLLEDGVMTHAELFTSNDELDTFARVWEVTRHVRHLVEKFAPDLVAMEGLAFSKFGNATRNLAGLQYSLVTCIRYIDGKDVVIIPPNTVKKVATGNGQAKKEQMYDMLPDDTKEFFINMGAKKTKGLYDLSDAYWIGQSCIKEALK